MKFGWLKARQTRYSAYLAAYLLVVLAVLVAVNFLTNRHNLSYDSTSNKRFTLSDQTLKVVRGLEKDARITFYDRTSSFTAARDLLDRYDNLSVRLTVAYVDPDKKPQAAKAAGVSNYGTIFVEANDKKEEAKSLTEEEITGALIRALKGGQRMVCAVAGSGEHSLDGTERTSYAGFKAVLERNNYATQTISLLEKPEVPKECTILVVGGPRFDYVEPAVKAVQSYVESGGRALVMLGPPLKLGSDNVSDNPGLVKLLEGWGVTLNKDLILDASGIGRLFGLGPEMPLVTSYESHAIVREMRSIASALPLVRSLEVKGTDRTTVEKLFSSSANSYATANLSSREIRINPDRDKKGPLAMAAAGVFNSGEGGAQGRFVAVGSSSWVSDYALGFNGNSDLAMNMMNWLSSDEDLISIRPKEPQDRRLTLTRAQMTRVFYSSVIGLPVLVILGGLGVWWRRR